MLQEQSASCARVVPTRELFLPGHRITHFTGPCRLEPRYEPADRSYLNFGPTRKCRCLLSHFGANVVARLFAAPGLNETACRRQRVEVAPPCYLVSFWRATSASLLTEESIETS